GAAVTARHRRRGDRMRRREFISLVGGVAVAWPHALKPRPHPLGLEVVLLEIQRAEDVAPAFETLTSQIDAVYIVGDASMWTKFCVGPSLAIFRSSSRPNSISSSISPPRGRSA